MKKMMFIPLGMFVLLGFFSGCAEKGCTDSDAYNYSMDAEKDDGLCRYTTQDLIESATTVVSIDLVGETAGVNTVPHDGGMTASVDSTFRSIWTSLGSSAGSISTGTVFTKKVHGMNPDGSKGDLHVAFAMVKRHEGYNTAGGDWEYMMIGADSTVDYSAHPFGMMPASEDDQMRGKLAMCGGCHANADGGDFVFMNN